MYTLNFLEKPLTDKCIVLDLDETLVHTHAEKETDTMELFQNLNFYNKPEYMDIRKRCYKITMDDVLSKRGEGVKSEMWGIFRPHVKEFLHFCFNYFKIVIIWSAGRRNYVEQIVDKLFLELKRPHIIYTFDDLEKLPDGTFIKPLNKLIVKYPNLNKYMGLHNSFIVDDRTSVFQEPNPNNGIVIPAYNPHFTVDNLRKSDIRLKQLMDWLQKPEVMKCSDIRTLNKNDIFL